MDAASEPLSRLGVTLDDVEAFCRKWKITEFAVFGSVVRSDFGPENDIDVLITLAPNHGWGLYEIVDIEEELEAMFKRPVDLVLKGGLRNPFRRREILNTRGVLYAA